MGFWKLSPFLALGFLVLYQVGIFQAAALRPVEENHEYHMSLSDEESDLLAELVNSYMKSVAIEQEKGTEDAGLDNSRAKRCSNLSTCMLSSYTQDLNKFHTFPQTAIGAGAPGKRRVMASGLERDNDPHVGMPKDAY
ncbi:calcitonin-like [Hipposideros larvatus]